MADLAKIQRRFYTLVTMGEGVVEPGLLAGPPRLDVYAAMYVARIIDVLADDYPKLRSALEIGASLAVPFGCSTPPRA